MIIFSENTEKTPLVEVLEDQGKINISGRSITENSYDFYKEFLHWVEVYAEQTQQDIEVNVHLEYFNTSTSKCLLQMFKSLEKVVSRNYSVKVNWFYDDEDEDMMEAGEDYRDVVNLDFNLKEFS